MRRVPRFSHFVPIRQSSLIPMMPIRDDEPLGLHLFLNLPDRNRRLRLVRPRSERRAGLIPVAVFEEEVAAAPAVEGEEPAEPEVIGKGKKEEEGGEEGGE